MPEPLTLEEVRRVARLARLDLDDAGLELYREQLSTVLDHVARLAELDLKGVEPMARPMENANRLDEDEVDTKRLLAIEQIAVNAPSMEGRFIAVPKVLGEEGA